jgi:hypothetical protein
MQLIDRIKAAWAAAMAPVQQKTTERGRPYDGNTFARSPYLAFQVDHEVAVVLDDVHRMDKEDGRVKELHNKIARDVTRGGIDFQTTEKALPPKIKEEAKGFLRRCKFDRVKLKAHARYLVAEGELFLQWIVDEKLNVVAGRRLPPGSMRPNVDENGRFRDLSRAYIQLDPMTNREIAAFALWQIKHISLDGNPDDPGSRGRAWLDASRVTHKKLTMTEEDLVIRRRMRAPRRNLHVLEGATSEELEAYKLRNKDVIENPLQVTSDYFSNKKGAVQPIEGDANLDQIGDVKALKADFFAGTGVPPPFFGYVDEINRDVYEDMLAAYYEILEEIQEILADGYEEGFRLQLLLRGINADGYRWDLKFAGRKVESQNQLSDRMLKHRDLGIPKAMIWGQLGYDVDQVKQTREEEADEDDPYYERYEEEGGANGNGNGTGKKTTIVQGNRRNKESATSIKN